MSAVLLLTCPHCGGQKMMFAVIAAQPIPNTQFFDSLGVCGGCKRGVLVRLRHPHQAHPKNFSGDLEQYEFSLEEQWPQADLGEAPLHTPDSIGRVYLQAISALKRREFDAAGAMARKTLDVATLAVPIEPPLTKELKLWQRVDRLHKAGKLTDQLKAWATAIRDDGNEAAHDPDLFTEWQAVQICEFVETFLEYMFTMPGKLEARKAKKEAAEL